jgi:hypothetical protein
LTLRCLHLPGDSQALSKETRQRLWFCCEVQRGIGMQRIGVCVLTSVVLGLTGCATMNPYIQHNRAISPGSEAACATPLYPNEATKYACTMAARMERARAEIVTARSGLTTAMFPLVGIVGYNSARGINAPTNAALVAGGFAGYSAVTTLAQPDRIRVYDNGLRSLSCALGKHGTAVDSALPEGAERRALRIEAGRILGLISVRRSKAGVTLLVVEELDSLTSRVKGVLEWLQASQPNRGFDSQLIAFTRTTVARVNSQLTLTVPDNKQVIGDALSALQAGLGTRVPDTTPSRAFVAAADPGDPELSRIVSAVDALMEQYQVLAANAVSNAAQIDFTECSYADINDLAFKDSIARFMFGPGDSYSGGTVTVIRPGEFDATLSGGIPPYTAAVTALKGDDKVTAVVTGSQLKITVKAAPGKTAPIDAGTYRIIVNDATNRYSKWLQVEVPKSE